MCVWIIKIMNYRLYIDCMFTSGNNDLYAEIPLIRVAKKVIYRHNEQTVLMYVIVHERNSEYK